MISIFNKIIYTLGVSHRSPELKRKFQALKESENWSLKELEQYQLSQLKSILNKAYENTDYYKKLYDTAKISPNDINTLDDLKMLPIISKSDLLNNTEAIKSKEEFKKLFLSETSGSTGEPLVFYRNGEWDASHRAAQLRGYSWYDVHPWERNGYFWGYNFSSTQRVKVQILDFLLNRFRLFSYSNDAIQEFSRKLRSAQYVEGYSSMIYEAAKIINMHGLGPYDLKLVKGTSEKIFDSYQEEAINAFGKKIISEYGAAETGIIAFECPYGNMHITMENVIVEEEDGEAIITNLVSDSFPIIRYKLGDSIVLKKKTTCPCGMKHEIIADVAGRVGKVIHGYLNNYPSLTLYYIFKNLSLKYQVQISYQAIQKEKGKLRIYLDKEINDKNMINLKNECKAYFKDDIEIDFYPNQLKRDYNKKFRDFISEID